MKFSKSDFSSQSAYDAAFARKEAAVAAGADYWTVQDAFDAAAESAAGDAVAALTAQLGPRFAVSSSYGNVRVRRAKAMRPVEVTVENWTTAGEVIAMLEAGEAELTAADRRADRLGGAGWQA